MSTNQHREEFLLILLGNAGIALDAESIAATYDTSIDEWQAPMNRLSQRGLVEPLGDGLYSLTSEGEEAVAPRGATGRPNLTTEKPMPTG